MRQAQDQIVVVPESRTHALTTAQVAHTLGVTISRVHQLARSRGVAPAMIAGRCLWPPYAVERLRPRASGYHGHAARRQQ